MSGSTNGDNAETIFADASQNLLEAIDVVFEGWLVRCVVDRLPDGLTPRRRQELIDQARSAAVRARGEAMPRLADLLHRDAEAQLVNPLSVLRGAVRHMTEVLEDAGARSVQRDEFEVAAFPDDRYDLSPARFDDIDEALHDIGLYWGAAKAHVVLRRH